MLNIEELHEFLTNLQVTLTSIDTKVTSLDTRISILETRIPDYSLIPATTEDAAIELSDPINRKSDPNSTNVYLARIEAKLNQFDPRIQKIEQQTGTADTQHAKIQTRLLNIERLVNGNKDSLELLHPKVDLVAEFQETHVDRFDQVDATLKKHDGKLNTVTTALTTSNREHIGRFDKLDQEIITLSTEFTGRFNKVDAAIKQHAPDNTTSSTRFNSLDKSVVDVNAKLKDINDKTDELVGMNKEHKIRDLAIYNNTIAREMNGKTGNNHRTHLVLHNVQTGLAVYPNLREHIESASREELVRSLQAVGFFCNLHNMPYLRDAKNRYWGCVRNDTPNGEVN